MTETSSQGDNSSAFTRAPQKHFITDHPGVMLLMIGLILLVLFGSYFIGIRDSWLEMLISTTGTFVLTLLIVLFGGLAAFKYRRLYEGLYEEVRSATDCVRKADDDGIDDLAEDFQKFGQPFPKLYQDYKQTFCSLRNDDGTTEFTNSDVDDLGGVVSLRPASDFFNEDSLYFNRINVPLYQSVPGILTGVGILFTFVGLAAGVALATKGLLPTGENTVGIDSSSVGALLKSIGSLLNGAGQAFITSITGLFISFFFAAWLHGCEHRLQDQIEELNQELSRKISYIDPERLAIIRTMRAIRQEKLVRNFAENWDILAEKFIENLTGKMSDQSNAQTERLVQAIDVLRQSVDKLSTQQTQTITSGVQEAMKQFSELLGEKMKEMAESFRESAEGVGKSVEALEVILSSTKDVMGDVVENVREAMLDFSSKVEELDRRISETATAVDEHLESMNRHSGEISERVETVGKSLVESAETAGTGFADKVIESASLFATGVDSAAGKFGEAVTGAADSVASTINDAAADFGRVMDEFAESQKALNEQIVEAGKAVSTATSNLTLCVERCRTLMADSVEVHAEGGEITREMLKRAQDACAIISGTSEESLKKVTVALSEFVQTADMLKKNAENIEELLLKSTESLGSALMRLNDSVCQNMSVTDKSLSGAIDSMSTALKDWTEMQESASASLRANTEEFRESVGKIATATQSLSGVITKLENNEKASE